MAKQLDVTIDESGNIEVDMQGFKGHGCGAILDAFKKSGTVTKEIIKPEYNQINQNFVRK